MAEESQPTNDTQADKAGRVSAHGRSSTGEPSLTARTSAALSSFSNPYSALSVLPQAADLSEAFVGVLLADTSVESLYAKALKRLGRRFKKANDEILLRSLRDLEVRADTEVRSMVARVLAQPDQRRCITDLIFRRVRPDRRPGPFDKAAVNIASVASFPAKGKTPVGTTEPTGLPSERRRIRVGTKVPTTNHAPPLIEDVKTFILEQSPFEGLKCELRFLIWPPQDIPDGLSQGQLSLRMYLERHFEEAAVGEYEWIRALEEVGYSREEIADLLYEEHEDSPWIYFDRNGPLAEFLAGIEWTATTSLNDLYPVLPGVELSACGISVARRLVEELCGLGGVSPESRNTLEWNGRVQLREGDSRAIISHSFNTIPMEDTKAVIARLLTVAQRLCVASAILEKSGFSRGSFTLLAVPSDRTVGTPLVQLYSWNVETVISLVNSYIDLLRLHERFISSSEELFQLWRQSHSVLSPIVPRDHIEEPFTSSILNVSSLAIQVLCVGLLSFTQAHTGNLRPFFLESTPKSLLLLGLQGIKSLSPSYPCVEVGMAELTCLSEMTGGPVIVFRSGMAAGDPDAPARFDVRATPNDILDTWGPGGFVHPKGLPTNPAVAISMGGGYVVPPPLQGNGGKYHWSRALTLPSDPPALDREVEIVIGATIPVNDSCTSDENICWGRSASKTVELGTYQSYYETTEHQLGAQAGCDYGTIVVNRVRTKRPGATLKDEILRSLIEFPASIFDYYCGVRVSYCTGVAQRVPMTQLIGDLLPVFATTLTSAQQRQAWKELESEHQACERFRGTEFAWADPQTIRDWLGTLSSTYHDCLLRLIRLIVSTLAATGLSPNGTFLAVAWPRNYLVKNCLRVPFDDDDAKWIPMLADAEDCATFAYITSACLPAEGVVACRGPNPVWGNKVHLLETAVSFPASRSMGSLCHGETYFFLKDGNEPAWFKAMMGEGVSHPSLVKLGTLWSIPRGLKRRVVILEQKKRNERRIQERRIFGHLAEEV